MQLMKTLWLAALLALTGSACAASPAQLSPWPLLHPLFQDHAVLQRDRPIDIWGWAAPGDKVTITVVSQAAAVSGSAPATATATAAGRWTATLPSMAAGGPYEITARTSTGATQSINDLLAGDVWLCSGQSNMVLEVRRTLNSRVEIADSANDSIRMLAVPLKTSLTPLETFITPVKWQTTRPETVPEFSAACFYFARELQKTVHVPMGLINSSWGGSSIQAWMSEGTLHAVGGYDAYLHVLHQFATEPQTGNQHWGAIWESWWRDRMGTEPWRASSVKNSDWRVAPQDLGYWEKWGVPELANFDGMVWYRTTLTLTARQAAQSATLALGPIDEVDATWLNGHWLGATSGASSERHYDVPPGTLTAGKNDIAVNVLDTYGFGGIYGPPEKRALHLADGTAIALNQVWRYQIVPASIGPALRAPWEEAAGLTVIHNAMIAPIGHFGLRGAVWYQGESNTNDASHYQPLLAGLMAGWRSQFGNDLPFLVVQLANYGPAATAPGQSDWATLREAQRLTVTHDAHAGLAIAIDIGDRYDIHPANKQELGRRLARAARHVAYGEAIAPSGPVPVSAHHDGGRIVVTFRDVDNRLVAYGANRPLGFELCGPDQASCRFSDATLMADRIVLEPTPGAMPASDVVPTRVRFCWANSPVCTLFDESGLPVGPFEMAIE